MKLSESLLHEKEFGERIFKSSLDKAKTLLTEIFDLDFINNDPKIINIIDEPENYKFEIIFDIRGRKITALFNFENDHDDILSEVLRIKETSVNDIFILDKAENFKDTVKNAMDYIEEKYDIDFTPLDPEEENKNIISTKYIKDESWLAIFNSDYYEAEFKAEYIFIPGSEAYLTITQCKNHIIYLE